MSTEHKIGSKKESKSNSSCVRLVPIIQIMNEIEGIESNNTISEDGSIDLELSDMYEATHRSSITPLNFNEPGLKSVL